MLVGDTDETDPLLADDEITTLITDRAVRNSSGGTVSVNIPAAAADAAGAIAAKFSRDFSFEEDRQRFDVAQRVGHYLSLEQTLRSRSGGYAVAIGGTLTQT
jgi:hypothetical protein